MSTMVKKRTAELVGAQLDWAVALALGAKIVDHYGRAKLQWDGACAVMDVLKNTSMIPTPNYSTEWGRGGPIIERERIRVRPMRQGPLWFAEVDLPNHFSPVMEGPTPLIAAMRAFVASKLGDEVEVPE